MLSTIYFINFYNCFSFYLNTLLGQVHRDLIIVYSPGSSTALIILPISGECTFAQSAFSKNSNSPSHYNMAVAFPREYDSCFPFYQDVEKETFSAYSTSITLFFIFFSTISVDYVFPCSRLNVHSTIVRAMSAKMILKKTLLNNLHMTYT